MAIYLIKIRGDECPNNNIDPASWENKTFQLKEYFTNLDIILENNSQSIIWINEYARKEESASSYNGFGLSAIAVISDVNSSFGTFTLNKVRKLSTHLNLENFLSQQPNGVFNQTYNSQRVRVRKIDSNDLFSIIEAYANLSS